MVKSGDAIKNAPGARPASSSTLRPVRGGGSSGMVTRGRDSPGIVEYSGGKFTISKKADGTEMYS